MKNVTTLLALSMLMGCQSTWTILPPGYYQPHFYKDKEQNPNNLAIVYGNCGNSENSTESFIGIWGVDDLKLDIMYAIKVYVKPGERKLRIAVNDGNNYGTGLDLEHEFLAGHKYQIVTQWGSTDGNFLEGYKREFKVGIIDMGQKYKPEKGIYTEHEHSDPLVVKDYSIPVSHHDCSSDKTFPGLFNESSIKPEYKKIFRDLGYDL